jgi:hypothetical protein
MVERKRKAIIKATCLGVKRTSIKNNVTLSKIARLLGTIPPGPKLLSGLQWHGKAGFIFCSMLYGKVRYGVQFLAKNPACFDEETRCLCVKEAPAENQSWLELNAGQRDRRT